MKQKREYYCIGAMSGTSLDGLDLASVRFQQGSTNWEHHVERTLTVPFPKELKNALGNIHEGSALELAKTDREFGRFIGNAIQKNYKEELEKVDLIGTHGHTIFHQPKGELTFQIGCGASIAKEAGKPVVCDLRSSNIEYGGQGAPLVPVGDELLYHEYDVCLNLGGFANISYQKNGARVASDICPVNMAINEVSRKLGEEYDKDGKIAESGEVDEDMFQALENLPFYKQKGPGSLGREWYIRRFQPLIDERLPEKDQIRTLVEHIATRVAEKLREAKGNSTLVSGGGAFNWFLLKRIRDLSPDHRIIIPDKDTIEYKEAVIFAFLGLLRWMGRPNIYASSTGSDRDTIGGAIYLPSPGTKE